MTIRPRSAILLYGSAFLLTAAVLAPRQACATLGAPESTAADDALQLKGDIKSTERGTYRVHEIQLPSGTVLREYAVPGSAVFAVAWSGPAVPNLSQVLGGYFTLFTDAAKVKHAGRTHFRTQQEGFVMESNGHMRSFSGRAYIPQAVPPATSLDEIR
jgi:hypothetical protein